MRDRVVVAAAVAVVGAVAYCWPINPPPVPADADRVHRLGTLSELDTPPGWTVAHEGANTTCSAEPGDRPGVWREVPGVSVDDAVAYYRGRLEVAGWKLIRTPLENKVAGARFEGVVHDFAAEVLVAPGHGGFGLRASVTSSPTCP